METGTGNEAGGTEGPADSLPRINPSDVSAARLAEFAGDSGNTADSRPGESRSDRAKRAWATRRANGNAPEAKERPAVNAAPRAEKKGSPLSVNSVEFALSGIHALLAAGLAAPELALQEAEAKIVAENIVAVARHYDLQATAKATDWGNLIVSLGVVYGGRIVAITARKSAEAKARRGHGNPVLQTGAAPPARDGRVTVQHPIAAGVPGGAMPGTRPKTRADDALLNEVEAAMF
jgi:hypothetical protein